MEVSIFFADIVLVSTKLYVVRAYGLYFIYEHGFRQGHKRMWYLDTPISMPRAYQSSNLHV